MGETLILTSTDGRILTTELVNTWLDANEMFITKKLFADDRYSVEVTFIDEETAELMSDLLNTCYGHRISISRAQTSIPTLNTSCENSRPPSPTCSVSSRISCFSHRLATMDRNKNLNNEQTGPTFGRGRGIISAAPSPVPSMTTKQHFSQPMLNINTAINENRASMISNNLSSPAPSVNSSASVVHGFGRGARFN